MKLYVGNLSFGTMEDDLQRLFSQVGSVESVSMVTDRNTGRSRGFAFVEMSSKSEGETAIAKFNGSELDGRSLTVSEAKPREDHGASEASRGGFGGDRNGSSRSGSFGRGRGSGRSRY
jgi:RNA recognition motif-containing protein